MRNPAQKDAAELDAVEAREWRDSLDYVLQSGGPVKVARLLRELTIHARQNGVKLPFTANTPYINTISADEQVPMPQGSLIAADPTTTEPFASLLAANTGGTVASPTPLLAFQGDNDQNVPLATSDAMVGRL